MSPFIGRHPRLEAELLGDKNDPCVLVTHPHPLYGGSMDNNVVFAACCGACAAGLSAWRFNFRGVGLSEGVSGEGMGETEDLLTAAEHLCPVALIGYSFGAWIITRAALPLPAILISPPTALFSCDFSTLSSYHIIAGTGDDFCDLTVLESLPAERLHLVDGMDHFWWGAEARLTQNIGKLLGSLTGRP